MLFFFLRKYRRGTKMTDELEKWEEAGEPGPWREDGPPSTRVPVDTPSEYRTRSAIGQSFKQAMPSFLKQKPPPIPTQTPASVSQVTGSDVEG